MATGDYNNLSLEVNSNLDPLIKNVQTNLLAKKMTEMKREKKIEIDRVKKEKLSESNKKKDAFKQDYEKTMNQLKFQKEEILNQKEVLENKSEESLILNSKRIERFFEKDKAKLIIESK